MGQFIVWADVVGRYPDAAKVGGAEAVSSSWIAGAEAEIAARLAARYSLPFASTPPLVQDLCIDLTYCKMTARQDSSDKIYERYLKTIAEVVAGTIVLVDATGAVIDAGAAALAWASNTYRTAFGPDTAENWSPSDAALDAAVDERQYD